MRGAVAHGLACLVAFSAPWLAAPSAPSESRFPGWPARFEGLPLQSVPLAAWEEPMAREFPGRIAKFTDGRRQILIRFVERDTRLYHPPAECLRAMGYDIRDLPSIVDSEGLRWGAFAAARGTSRLVVRERIHEVDGDGGWTDVSSWYWAAAFKRSAGPWWSVTVAETSPPAPDP
jgi:hypothetical protein